MNNLKVCFAFGFFMLLSSGASQANFVTSRDWNLTCLIIDGEGSNDVLTILQVDKSGNARGALCFLDLQLNSTQSRIWLENCHDVEGMATEDKTIRIEVKGGDLDETGSLIETSAAFYIDSGLFTGRGAVFTSKLETGAGADSSQGTAMAAPCNYKIQTPITGGSPLPKRTFSINFSTLKPFLPFSSRQLYFSSDESKRFWGREPSNMLQIREIRGCGLQSIIFGQFIPCTSL